MKPKHYIAVAAVLIIAAAVLVLSRTQPSIERIIIEVPRDRIPPVIHWHPHLTIVINGNQTAISAGIGLYNNSEALIHTHDDSGVLHMEQTFPQNETLTLGYFFHEVWNQTLNASCIFEHCTNATHELAMWVNGARSHEYASYSMRDRDIIILIFGKSYSLVSQF